jgi:hypothetical protein
VERCRRISYHKDIKIKGTRTVPLFCEYFNTHVTIPYFGGGKMFLPKTSAILPSMEVMQRMTPHSLSEDTITTDAKITIKTAMPWLNLYHLLDAIKKTSYALFCIL